MAKEKPATEVELEELQELYLQDKDNKEVIENIAIIRSALKMMRLGALNNPNLRQKIERALKWVDLYIVK